jgi:hypothetical protein
MKLKFLAFLFESLSKKLNKTKIEKNLKNEFKYFNDNTFGNGFFYS